MKKLLLFGAIVLLISGCYGRIGGCGCGCGYDYGYGCCCKNDKVKDNHLAMKKGERDEI